jgi:hypothetical protein
MNFLRQSTAVDVAIGPFVDDDGITPATGLSITQAECRLKKNNGAWAQCSDVTTATHEEEGWYEKELDATDTNTCGILVLAVYISGNLPYWKEYAVVEEAVYDMLFAASAVGYIANAPVNVAQWLGSAAATPTVAGVPEVDVTHWLGTAAATPTVAGVPEVDVTHFGGSAGTFASGRPETNVNAIAANAITAAATAADFGTEIGTAVWATAARELTALDEDNTTIDLNGTTIGTVTNVTTVNGLAANVITAAATAADFGTEVGTAVWATALRLISTQRLLPQLRRPRRLPMRCGMRPLLVTWVLAPLEKRWTTQAQPVRRRRLERSQTQCGTRCKLTTLALVRSARSQPRLLRFSWTRPRLAQPGLG